MIEVNLEEGLLELLVDPAELERRHKAFKPLFKPVEGRWLARYRAIVQNASTGAILPDF